MKNKFKGLGITVIIAAIISLSLAGGYKFITLVSPAVKTQFDTYTDPIVDKLVPQPEPFEYKEHPRRDDNQFSIYSSNGYIYNSEGKVISDFRNEYGSELRFVTSVDGSVGVLTKEGKCYLFDSFLNKWEVADHCQFAGMSFNGESIFYLKRDGDSEVHVYDIVDGKDHLITEVDDYVYCVCISPDGKTVVYNYEDDMKTIYIKGLDTEEKVYKAKNCDVVVSVSNDGETVFYYEEDGDDRIYYCLDHGKSVKLGKKNIGRNYLDRECKQMVYKDDKDRIMYYKAGEKAPVFLLQEEHADMYFNNIPMQQQDVFMDEYIVDTDSFSDSMMIASWYKCYALYGNGTPELVEITKDFDEPFDIRTCVTDRGPSCLCICDGKMYKIEYDGERIKSYVYADLNQHAIYYTCSADLSEVWVYNYKSIYYIEDGSEMVEVFRLDDNSRFTDYDITWDPTEDLCYYVVDTNLCCVGATPDSNETVMENCKWLSYNNAPDLIHAEGDNANYYIIVNKKVLPEY